MHLEKRKCKDKNLGPRSKTQTWTLKYSLWKKAKVHVKGRSIFVIMATNLNNGFPSHYDLNVGFLLVTLIV
jgi:hypothetical protein